MHRKEQNSRRRVNGKILTRKVYSTKESIQWKDPTGQYLKVFNKTKEHYKIKIYISDHTKLLKT
jgi:hypothetical protein